VKVLAWHRPDSSETVRTAQQDFAARIGDACRRYDIPYLFELLVYPLPGEANQTTQYIEMADKKSDLVLESVRTFAEDRYGIDVFKLESPVPASAVPGPEGPDPAGVQNAFDEMGRLAGRPWVMLSAGAGMQEFRSILAHAYRAGASGYLAGRAIWAEPFKLFPDWDAIRAGLRGQSIPYMRELNALTDAAATPWFEHPRFGGTVSIPNHNGTFRRHYHGFGG
jgi:tagatose 1,6-diphosphate aldolase